MVQYKAEHNQNGIKGARAQITYRMGEKRVGRAVIRWQAGSEFTPICLVISLVHSFTHSSIQQIFTEHLLCSKQCSKCQGHSSEQNREGSFSKRIYRLMAIGNEVDLGVRKWCWNSELAFPNLEPSEWIPRSCSSQPFPGMICPE